MNQLEKKFRSWHEENPTVCSLVCGLASLLVLATVNIAYPSIPALRSLYILPIWIGTRLGGRLVGLILVGLATATNVGIDFAQSPSIAVDMFGGLIWFSVFTVVMFLVAQVEDSLHRTERLAHQDALTGLYNRRGLELEGRRLLNRALRERRVLTVAMIDCDRFKKINDEFGHRAGDDALRFLSRTLEENTRGADVLCRLGGDEFVLVLDDTDLAEARMVVARIEKAFEDGMASHGYNVSLSSGLSQSTGETVDLRTLVSRADADMYVRKEEKRDRLAAG